MGFWSLEIAVEYSVFGVGTEKVGN